MRYTTAHTPYKLYISGSYVRALEDTNINQVFRNEVRKHPFSKVSIITGNHAVLTHLPRTSQVQLSLFDY